MTPEELLGRKKLRATAVRKALLRVFLEEQGPFGAIELHAMIATGDLSSVYRALEALDRTGILRRCSTPGSTLLYCLDSLDGGSHNHFECSECGRLTHFSAPSLEDSLEEIQRRCGFVVTGAELHLTGKCCDCSRKNAR